MSGKSDIAFLLNPTSSNDVCQKVTTPTSPLSSFQHLIAAAHSPDTTVMSSLMLLGSCITPLEKRSASKKTSMPILSLAALSEASSNSDGDDTVERQQNPPAAKPKSKAGRKRVRKNRSPPCQVDGCKNIAVSRGCCVRHGGGSRCTVEGCPNRAKLYKLCFQHGGFKTCASEGCTRKSKRYGHCWSHGGGRICVIPDCSKVSTQDGLCWAHGGGNRCKLDGCSRRSYQKYGYYCVDHASLNELKTK